MGIGRGSQLRRHEDEVPRDDVVPHARRLLGRQRVEERGDGNADDRPPDDRLRRQVEEVRRDLDRLGDEPPLEYSGTVDESGRILHLEAEGPNFLEEGKIGKFRDSYEFKSKDHIVATSAMQDENGKWVTFMTGNIRRKK